MTKMSASPCVVRTVINLLHHKNCVLGMVYLGLTLYDIGIHDYNGFILTNFTVWSKAGSSCFSGFGENSYELYTK